jgi:hypothetical protein
MGQDRQTNVQTVASDHKAGRQSRVWRSDLTPEQSRRTLRTIVVDAQSLANRL